MRFADCRKLKIFHSPRKDLSAFHNPPAAGNSRTRRPGAGLSAQAALSPAMQPVVRRPPAKRFALPLFSPSLTRPRLFPGACPRTAPAPAVGKTRTVFVSAFEPRTHAVVSGCEPAHGFCFPGQAGAQLLFPAAGRKPAPAAGKSRGCAGQIASLVCAFAQPRTHAVLSGCVPTHGSCFPGQGGNLVSVLCSWEKTRRAKAPAHPQSTETPEKLSSAPLAFRAFPLPAGLVRPERPH